MAKVMEALTPTESDDSKLLVTSFCPNLETFELRIVGHFFLTRLWKP